MIHRTPWRTPPVPPAPAATASAAPQFLGWEKRRRRRARCGGGKLNREGKEYSKPRVTAGGSSLERGNTGGQGRSCSLGVGRVSPTGVLDRGRLQRTAQKGEEYGGVE
ncbi:hypothetical protein PR202_gb11198 [Eleusine coracana subsp. coracana]|uniref:Uncharacterized protein n=1 Tax=Eleusine coracana subsp. coracana TaxID=191504 RepID=A0AAV5ELY8_ELECO|nr:hypothetical protein PR202_gb11198 [Eleusine coracana subsp. coracana]